MDPWLERARDAVAARAGVPPEALHLSSADVRMLLEAARVAAHDSGQRTNAPLLCYLLGLAGAGGVSLVELVEAVPPSTS